MMQSARTPIDQLRRRAAILQSARSPMRLPRLRAILGMRAVREGLANVGILTHCSNCGAPVGADSPTFASPADCVLGLSHIEYNRQTAHALCPACNRDDVRMQLQQLDADNLLDPSPESRLPLPEDETLRLRLAVELLTAGINAERSA